ncbi:MAG: murein biosynthesis integral membrane protein MurJ [Nitrospirota bacterium]|nr:murein biosynthesis integral membrane protein MurJ [Nitrospirota bacterium]
MTGPPTGAAAGSGAGSEAGSVETARVARAAGVIGLFTLLSRVLGFVRDMVVARAFGASQVADAFFVAFRIPNMLRELLAEGSMSAAFVPVFTEKLATAERRDAWELASRVFTLLLVLLVGVTCLGILAAPLLVKAMAPGFSDSPEQHRLTVLLTRIMFPYLLFVGLAALAMGILNSLRAFALPAVSPLFLNLAMISAALWVAPHMQEPALGLALGVLAGGMLQLGIQLPGLIRHRMLPHFTWAPRDPDVRRVGRLMLPMVFALSVTQVNLLVNTLLASFLAEGSVSYLYYAMRLIQFPLGVFGVALATAILPSLSAQVARGDMDGMCRGVVDGLRLILYVTVPAMLALIALRMPIVSTLFERGAFDAAATRGTAMAVFAYASGLWAFAGVRIAASTFYALGDTATPVRIAAIAMVGNIALNLALMGPLGHAGLALATALAAMVNLGLLLASLHRKLPQLRLLAMLPGVGRTVLAAALMAALCAWVADFSLWGEGSVWARAGGLAGVIPVSALLYMGTHRLLGGDEGPTLIRAVGRRRRKPGGEPGAGSGGKG